MYLTVLVLPLNGAAIYWMIDIGLFWRANFSRLLWLSRLDSLANIFFDWRRSKETSSAIVWVAKDALKIIPYLAKGIVFLLLPLIFTFIEDSADDCFNIIIFFVAVHLFN